MADQDPGRVILARRHEPPDTLQAVGGANLDGGFVPGIRPGPPTSALLRYVLNRLTAPGSVYLALVAMFPLVALDKIGLGQFLQLSGDSLLIMVGVGLDTVKQIQSQLEQHFYQGFLR